MSDTSRLGPMVNLQINAMGELLQSAFMARIEEFEPLLKTAITDAISSANFVTIVKQQVNKYLEEMVGSILREPELQASLKTIARKTIIESLKQGDIA